MKIARSTHASPGKTRSSSPFVRPPVTGARPSGRCGSCPDSRVPLGSRDDRLERAADGAAAAVDVPAARGAAPTGSATSSGPVAGSVPRAGVQGALEGPGQPLGGGTRSFMERRLGHDFGDVRVHAHPEAASSAAAFQARAYTFGRDIAFGAGEYRPSTSAGRRLLAHELAHVVQQRGAEPRIQRQERGRVTVRSPVFEETVTQASDVAGSLRGRPLSADEWALAQPIFGSSIDFGRVRLVTADALQFRTVGNNIYVPRGFTVENQEHAQTLIHELTHVWQYQRSGTSYISVSLGHQIAASITRGNRNFAYDYTIRPGASFFEFNPEQQGSIVENWFAMLRDQAAIPVHRATGVARQYRSNHLGADGFHERISATERMAEIHRELPLHRPLIAQMQASVPRPELEIVRQRASEVIATPRPDLFPEPEERRLAPIRPLLRIDFDIPGL